MPIIILELLVFVKFCQTSVWAFDKILPSVVLGLFVCVKFCQTSIWAFEHNVIIFTKNNIWALWNSVKIIVKLVFGLYERVAKIIFEFYEIV